MEELKQRCEKAGLVFEYDEEIPNLLLVHYPRGTGTDCIEVWDDQEARRLLQEPFERYEGLDGFQASWSTADGIIECNVIWVDGGTDESAPTEQPSPDVIRQLKRLRG